MFPDFKGIEVVLSRKENRKNIVCPEQIGKPFAAQLLLKAVQFLTVFVCPLLSGYSVAFK